MAETATTTAAEKLASSLTGQEESESTDPIVDEEVSQEEVDETPDETEESTEETEELPDKIKDILAKNRKATRDAEARAVAAEKALAAKESAPDGVEAAPADDKFKTLFINTAAKSALVEAGLSTGTDRFLKMLDLSSVSVDDSGKVTGLDDQIAELKSDFKDLLEPKVVKKTVTKADGAGRREVPAIPKTTAELLAGLVR